MVFKKFKCYKYSTLLEIYKLKGINSIKKYRIVLHLLEKMGEDAGGPSASVRDMLFSRVLS